LGTETLAALEMQEELMHQDEELVPGSFPILKQITNEDAVQREIACAQVSNIVVDNAEAIQIILSKGAHKDLIKNLFDPVLLVRIAAAGALRNMVIGGDLNLIEQLVKAEIMTPLLWTFQQLDKLLVNDSNKQQDQQEGADLLFQELPLLAYLCEGSDAATNQFVNGQGPIHLLQVLKTASFNPNIQSEAASLLQIVSDNNPACAQMLLANNEIPIFLGNLVLDQNTNVLVRVLVAGVLFNIAPAAFRIKSIQTVMPLLVQIVEFQTKQSLAAVTPPPNETPVVSKPQPTQQTPENNNNNDEEEEVIESAPPVTPTTPDLEKWKTLMKSQQTALEILTNICSEDFNEELVEAEDNNQDDTAEQTMEDETSNVNLNVTVKQGEYENVENVDTDVVTLATDIQQLITQHQLLPKVIELTTAFPQELLAKFEHCQIIKLCQTAQMRALGCISNLLMAYDVSAYGDPTVLWNLFFAQCKLPQVYSNPDLMEQLSAVMWLLLKKLYHKKIPFVPTVEQAEALAQVAETFSSESLRVNAIGMLGIIAQSPQMLPAMSNFARLFLKCSEDKSNVVVAEALNSIFDVFAETQHNQVVKETDMCNRLIKVLHNVKNTLKTGRRKLQRDVRARLEECEINLSNFLKYKYEQFK